MPKLTPQKKYPPPRQDKHFVTKWNTLIEEVVGRENFKAGHLYQLEILCDLYLEQEKLKTIIEVNGTTYYTESPSGGVQKKLNPEVAQLNRVRDQIGRFSKALGLELFKDTKVTKGDDEQEEWE